MAQKLDAPFPPNFDLGANYIVQLTAVDPTSGAVVTGVNVSNVAIMAAAVVSDISNDDQPDYAPVFLPIPSAPPSADEAA